VSFPSFSSPKGARLFFFFFFFFPLPKGGGLGSPAENFDTSRARRSFSTEISPSYPFFSSFLGRKGSPQILSLAEEAACCLSFFLSVGAKAFSLFFSPEVDGPPR